MNNYLLAEISVDEITHADILCVNRIHI